MTLLLTWVVIWCPDYPDLRSCRRVSEKLEQTMCLALQQSLERNVMGSKAKCFEE